MGQPRTRGSQGGDDGGRSHGGDGGRRSQQVTPNNISRLKAHIGVDGERSHGGALVERPDGTIETTDRG